MASANKLTLFIVIFMLAGILSGAAIHEYASADAIKTWSDNITLLTDIFLRLIKMVIAPLVFSTLTVGIMKMGETSTIGRVGGKAMVWFISSSVLSILVGLFIVTLEHPGSGLNLTIPTEAVDTGLAVGGMTLKAFLSHTIPTSIAGAMANNEILQIVVFSMFFGIGGASLGQKFNAPLVAALDVVAGEGHDESFGFIGPMSRIKSRSACCGPGSATAGTCAWWATRTRPSTAGTAPTRRSSRTSPATCWRSSSRPSITCSGTTAN